MYLGLGTLQYPSIDAAIQKFEGFTPGSLSYRNNNPGNMVYSSWMAPYGCTPGGAGGFAQCPTLDAGQQILDARVGQLVNQGDSVSDLISTWAGPQYAGNTQASYQSYVASVAADTGLDPSLPISAQMSVADTSGGDISSIDTTDGQSSNLMLWGLAIAGVVVLVVAAS